MTTSTPSPDAGHAAIDLTIVVPMYQEARRIGPTLADLALVAPALGLASEIVLVDDGSRDETIHVVRPWLTETPQGGLQRVRLVRHEVNRGKGAAVRTGLGAGAGAGAWRLMMDADNACTLRQVPRLLAHAGPGVGLIAGSRVAQGARVEARPHRRLAGWVFKLALRVMGLALLRDTQCGFKLYRADLAEQIVRHAREDGYAFDLEHLLIARATGLRTVEVGVEWTHREGGQVSPIADGLRMLRAAAGIRARWSAQRARIARLPDAPGRELDREPRVPEIIVAPAPLLAGTDARR